jgi:hypothetical protein
MELERQPDSGQHHISPADSQQADGGCIPLVEFLQHVI